MNGNNGNGSEGAEDAGCGPACEIERDPDTGEITAVRIEPSDGGDDPGRSDDTLRRLLEGAGASSDEAEFYVTRFLPSLGTRRSPGAGGAGGQSAK
ncbi:MAG TPA: hypothetical protein VM490_24895 [Armatimonadaceae bacterium]|nr:hypothetical protein [Armatimonadaceae bacterium]